ncbi:MAG TPA: helix-hairpin-helix domain-containing protein [Sphingobacteriaceae bacterium]
MDNKIISRTLNLLSQLMELHGDNPFKVKSLAASAYKIGKLPFSIADKSAADIEKIEGMGKSTALKVTELVQTKSIGELESLLKITPTGIVEMLQVKGIGPKKVQVIWKELGIENLGELYYACNENRLIEAKGFGAKTQEDIRKVIEFKMASNGRFLYASAENFAEELIRNLKTKWSSDLVYPTGGYRRKCEVLDGLSILAAVQPPQDGSAVFEALGLYVLKADGMTVETEAPTGINVQFTFCKPEEFWWLLFKQTGTDAHVNEVISRLPSDIIHAPSEEDIYKEAGLQFIEPELREGSNEIERAQHHAIPRLITFGDLKGTLHNHSTWSDGVHTLEEMAIFCRDELNLEYLGISDHSKSAFYARGLNEEQIIAQHREIDELNERLAPFRIFKGIEADILYDGSLDYTDDVLAKFDFVVASVHSILKMNEEKATDRLLKAIENPFTTILGHPTGRLLLTRSGYPIDHKKVIDACAANNVVIEINSNPLRLDMDWRWHQYALEKGVTLSINPDAHRNEGFYDMHFGVMAGRKGGLSPQNCLNARSLDEIEAYFEKKKAGVKI